MRYDVLNTLERDVENLRWTPQCGGEVAHEFCLFSRSGFNLCRRSPRQRAPILAPYTTR